MYQVKKIWYHLYWVYSVGCNLLLLLLWVLAHYSARFGQYSNALHIDTVMVVLVAVNLVYLGTVYWLIARRNVPLSVLCSALLFAFVLMNGISETGGSKEALLYAVMWVLAAFFNAMQGLAPVMGWVFLVFVTVLLQYHFEIARIRPIAWFLLVGYSLLTLVSYFFWRSRFISPQEEKVNELSGMLRSNQQQSEILLESLTDGVVVINTEGKITLMNPAAAKMTGWPVNEALGIDAQLVVKLAQENGEEIIKEDNPFGLVLTRKEPVNRALQLAAREGRKLFISLVLSPVVIPKSNRFVGAVAVLRDISEEHLAEKQRGEFISTASHEMRTPVAAIEGYLALALNEKVSTVDSRARGYLEKAHASTQHLGKLFQDLLTSSKAEDGRLSNHPAVVEMGAFMQQLTDDLKFAAEKKGLFAEFLVGSSETIDATSNDATQAHMVKPLYYVYVDPDRMREVITNLFDNASKYTEQGKISIGLTGDVSVVQLYIRDTGAGIPADDIPHLFQKFYRVDNSATRTIGGTGLGLFICRKIVELYHGRIWVESTLGKGSTFFINLPRLSTHRAAELQAAEAAASASHVPMPSTSLPS